MKQQSKQASLQTAMGSKKQPAIRVPTGSNGTSNRASSKQAIHDDMMTYKLLLPTATATANCNCNCYCQL